MAEWGAQLAGAVATLCWLSKQQLQVLPGFCQSLQQKALGCIAAQLSTAGPQCRAHAGRLRSSLASLCLQAVVAGFNALDRARALVQLTLNTGSERANEWALIYFCLRAGLHKEALQVSHDWLQNCDGTGLVVGVWAGQGKVVGAAGSLLMALQKDTAAWGAGACCCLGNPRRPELQVATHAGATQGCIACPRVVPKCPAITLQACC